MQTVKQWPDGGSLTVAYEGSRDGDAVVSSDINEGTDREMPIYFVDVSKSVNIKRNVTQIGRRHPFSALDGDFVLSDGGIFNVLKS